MINEKINSISTDKTSHEKPSCILEEPLERTRGNQVCINAPTCDINYNEVVEELHSINEQALRTIEKLNNLLNQF